MIINRDIYLNRLIKRKNNGMIKVITGVRRSGKSYLLFNLFYNHLVDDNIMQISTVDGIHNILHQVFQVAVDDDLIRNNPTDNSLRELRLTHTADEWKRKALTIE